MDSVFKRVSATLAATAASGVIFYFGTGLTPIAALTWLAYVPILLLAPRVGGWTAGFAGFVAGLLGATNLVSWFAFSHDIPLWPFGPLILLSFSIPVGIGAAAFRALVLRGRLMLAVFAVPAIWVSLLYAVAQLNPQGIMGTLATPQTDIPVLMQSVSVIGMWGLEFLVPLVGAAVAALFAPGVRTAARLRTIGLAGVIMVLVVAGGVWRLGAAESGAEHKVAMLSKHDSAWGVKMSTSAGKQLLNEYLDEIDALEDVDIIVLPEGEFGVTPKNRGTLMKPLKHKAKQKGATILVGYADEHDGEKYNVARAITAEGQHIDYFKHHDMVSPPNSELAYEPGSHGDVAIEICGDMTFPDPSDAYGAGGARLALIPGADEKVNGWMHARTAMLRAAENGFSIAWAARFGTLTAADGYGRVLAEKPTGDGEGIATVVADIPAGPSGTVYSATGDWAAWMSVVLSLAAIGFALRPNRSAQSPKAS